MSDKANQKRVSTTDLKTFKAEGRKISAITCYDACFAKLIDRTDIDVVLVGDSLSNVMLGYENTLKVTMDQMVHHAAAVVRSNTRSLIIGDMPFMSYGVSVEDSVFSAGRLMKEAGVHAVKLESCSEIILTSINRMVEVGIPVAGHLGFTPQSLHQIGGTKVAAKNSESRRRILEDAKKLEQAGVFCIFLEMVPEEVAAEIQKVLTIPTIGIGAGKYCDGQVLVLQDMLGMSLDFNPKFLKKYADIGGLVIQALNTYTNEVREGRFPSREHSYTDKTK